VRASFVRPALTSAFLSVFLMQEASASRGLDRFSEICDQFKVGGIEFVNTLLADDTSIKGWRCIARLSDGTVPKMTRASCAEYPSLCRSWSPDAECRKQKYSPAAYAAYPPGQARNPKAWYCVTPLDPDFQPSAPEATDEQVCEAFQQFRADYRSAKSAGLTAGIENLTSAHFLALVGGGAFLTGMGFRAIGAWHAAAMAANFDGYARYMKEAFKSGTSYMMDSSGKVLTGSAAWKLWMEIGWEAKDAARAQGRAALLRKIGSGLAVAGSTLALADLVLTWSMMEKDAGAPTRSARLAQYPLDLTEERPASACRWIKNHRSVRQGAEVLLLAKMLEDRKS
jgi:hypothetical protein